MAHCPHARCIRSIVPLATPASQLIWRKELGRGMGQRLAPGEVQCAVSEQVSCFRWADGTPPHALVYHCIFP